MASENTLYEIDGRKSAATELAPSVIEELREILENSEQAEPPKAAAGTYWQYGVPQVGVRVYSYADG